MSRLQAALTGKKSLVCFVTAGDPAIEKLPEIVQAIAEAGADAIEIGLPFSDPIADGPTIQASSQRALDRSITVSQVFDAVAEARKRTDVPFVLMTYYNPVLQIGLGAFADRAKAVGIDGLIITDLTPEESGPWKAAVGELDTIFLLAPTSTDERIATIAQLSTGFVYCVSRTGVTGSAEIALDEAKALVEMVQAATKTPALVGFGIKNRLDVERITAFADGAVVGSALVQAIHEADDPVEVAGSFVRGLR